jgi:ATP-dependent Zn protease
MDNNKFLHTLAEALLINETIDAEEMSIVYHCYLSDKKIEDSLKSSPEETTQA